MCPPNKEGWLGAHTHRLINNSLNLNLNEALSEPHFLSVKWAGHMECSWAGGDTTEEGERRLELPLSRPLAGSREPALTSVSPQSSSLAGTAPPTRPAQRAVGPSCYLLVTLVLHRGLKVKGTGARHLSCSLTWSITLNSSFHRPFNKLFLTVITEGELHSNHKIRHQQNPGKLCLTMDLR